MQEGNRVQQKGARVLQGMQQGGSKGAAGREQGVQQGRSRGNEEQEQG